MARLSRATAGAVVLTLLATAGAAAGLVRGGGAAVILPKLAVASLALTASLYDLWRTRRGAPLRASLRRRVGVALGAAAMSAYYVDARLTAPAYFHVWDQYHYFLGSKYFRELGYGRLYRCSAIAMDQGGPALRARIRAPGAMIRDLEGGNGLIPADAALREPERCTGHFSPERWRAFVADVGFFQRGVAPAYGAAILRDHGYNPPPLWSALGGTLAGLAPASAAWLRTLAAIDLLLVAASFTLLGRTFGWRTTSLAAVLWSCQSLSPFYWTGGAYLRQDWFFLMTLAACQARRRRFVGAGAAVAAAGLLRVFPLLAALGWLVGALDQWRRRRAVPREHLRLLAGGLLATLVLLPLGAAHGWEAYPEFTRHIRQHASTPLTNLVGLRTLTAYRPGSDAGSGRMAHTVDFTRTDPHREWKAARLQRVAATRPWTAALVVAGLIGFAAAVRRRSPWAALCLGIVPVFLIGELTSYYYSILVLAAPLARLRRWMEPGLLAFVVLSMPPMVLFGWNDDRYAAISLLLALLLAAVVAGFAWRRALRSRPVAPRPSVPAPSFAERP